MGGAESSGHESSTKKTNFRLHQHIFDRRYGQVKLMIDQTTGQIAVVKEQTASEKAALSKSVMEAERRLKNPHPGLQKLIQYLKIVEEETCGAMYKVSFLFEYIKPDLELEIQGRAPNRQHFSESELTFLARTMINVCAFLQSNNIAHQDIRPSTILITQNHEFKLSDPLLALNGLSQYQQIVLRLHENSAKCYLSPQLYQSLNNPSAPPVHDIYKSDVFSLGMTLLEAATLDKIEICYDYTRNVVDPAAIGELLGRASNRYSNELIALIRDMLTYEEFSRPDFIMLQRRISGAQMPQQHHVEHHGPHLTFQQPPQQPSPAQHIQYKTQEVVTGPPTVYRMENQAPPPVNIPPINAAPVHAQPVQNNFPSTAQYPPYHPTSTTTQYNSGYTAHTAQFGGTQQIMNPQPIGQSPTPITTTIGASGGVLSDDLRKRLGLRPNEEHLFSVGRMTTPGVGNVPTALVESRPIGAGHITGTAYTPNPTYSAGIGASPAYQTPLTTGAYNTTAFTATGFGYQSPGTNNHTLSALDQRINEALRKSEDTYRRFQSRPTHTNY